MSDFNIGSQESSETYVGNVLSADPTDIYRLTLDAPGSFSGGQIECRCGYKIAGQHRLCTARII
jgi:hypothetical protein